MTRTGRLLVAAVLAITAALALGIGVAAAAVARAGSVGLSVESSEGGRTAIRVPAIAAHAALALVPDLVWDGLSPELGPWAAPLATFHGELARRPDFKLLEVDSDGQHVEVRKVGRSLVVDVDDGGERVRVELPLALFDRVARRIGRTASR